MSAPYAFGLSQEDELIDGPALGVGPGSRVLAVAAAGDMPLSLLAQGAEKVTAVDFSQAQLHLCRLKAAAVAGLSREEALRFLGYLDCSSRERAELLPRLLPRLEPGARAFWEARPDVAASGAVRAGRYERYVFRVAQVCRLWLGRGIRELIACETTADAQTCFARRLDRAWLRGVFRLMFHPRIYAPASLGERALSQRKQDAGSLGMQLFMRFRDFCCANPPARNPFLQMHLLGRLASASAAPYFLSEEGFSRARAALDRVEWVCADLGEAVATRAGGHNAFQLSNVGDWMDAPAFEGLLRAIARSAPPGSRLLWRFIHADREVPADVAGVLETDRPLGERLRSRDRFPFYSIVPARLEARA